MKNNEKYKKKNPKNYVKNKFSFFLFDTLCKNMKNNETNMKQIPKNYVKKR